MEIELSLVCNCNHKMYCDKYSLLIHQKTLIHIKNTKSKCVPNCNCDTCAIKSLKKDLAYLKRLN